MTVNATVEVMASDGGQVEAEAPIGVRRRLFARGSTPRARSFSRPNFAHPPMTPMVGGRLRSCSWTTR